MKITQDHIDKYLRNELDANQLHSFQELIKNDSQLQEEVLLNEAIKKGLTEVRKSELKMRLDAIDITPSTWINLGNIEFGGMIKVVGVVVTASLIGIGGFFLLMDEDKTLEVEEIFVSEIDFPKAEDDVSVVYIDEEKFNRKSSLEIQNLNQSINEKDTKISNVNDEQASLKKKRFIPSVLVPKVDQLEIEENLGVENEVLSEFSTTNFDGNQVSSNIEIETVQNEDDELKYKYFDGRLLLIGNFKGLTYEILEINRNEGKSLYLILGDKFFEIKAQEMIQDLRPLNNESLLSELRIIRNNKQ